MSIDAPRAATKDTMGEYDAIETAKPGEPLFPIQGGDPFGPATVQFWVDLCRKAGMHEEDQKKAEALLRKASDAERIGWLMQDYQRGIAAAQPTSGPGAPKATPTYSGWNDPADEETKARRLVRAGRIETAEQLHNVVAMAFEAADRLAKLRCCPLEEALIREAVEKLQDAAREVEPRRGRERT
jgi:hypothetical protein